MESEALAAQATTAPTRSPAQRFILITVLLDIMGFGLVIPVLPTLVGKLADSRASQVHWIGWLMAVYAVMQFLCAPLLGAMSDRFGRRPVLLVSLLGLAIGELIYAQATSLAVLLGARILMGGTSATMSVASSYVADITPPQGRAEAFGRIGAAFSVGFIVGPMLGGLLGEHDVRLPFYAASALAMLSFAYGLLVLPESLPADRRTPLSWQSASPFGAIGDLLKLRSVAGLVPVIGLGVFAQVMLQTVWVMYTEFRFGWGPAENGLILLVIGGVAIVAEGVLLGRLQRRWGDRRLAMVGLVSGAAAFLLYALAVQGWMLYAIALVTGLSAVAAPVLNGLVSSEADAARQGTTMGALSSINSLVMIVAPLVATASFGWVSQSPAGDWLLGTSFYLCLAIQTISIVIAMLHFSRRREQAVQPG